MKILIRKLVKIKLKVQKRKKFRKINRTLQTIKKSRQTIKQIQYIIDSQRGFMFKKILASMCFLSAIYAPLEVVSMDFRQYDDKPNDDQSNLGMRSNIA